jgi:predicted RNA-binding Zn-ribbon protein involved in translation (DUF1610 family)
MSNPDLLNQADSILRPVLRKLARISWLRVTGCCAGHKPEDTVWFELHLRGTTGITRLRELLRLLESKLDGTDCRADCLINYGESSDSPEAPHGWFSITLEVFWPARDDWRRSQALIVEALLSSVEDYGEGIVVQLDPEGAINYCPFCSSSFLRLESFERSGHRYRCGDCESFWTMIDPKL